MESKDMEKNSKKDKQSIKNKDIQENTKVKKTADNQHEKQSSNCEQFEQEVKELQEKLNKLNDQYLRLAAEYDNYRKRTVKEKADLIKTAAEKVLVDLLPVIDDFERALEHIEKSEDIEALKDGVKLIYNHFQKFLKQQGVEEIEALGQQLNTDFHEAVQQVPVENQEQKGKIVHIVQKGYKLYDKVIRHAKVVVGM